MSVENASEELRRTWADHRNLLRGELALLEEQLQQEQQREKVEDEVTAEHEALEAQVNAAVRKRLGGASREPAARAQAQCQG